MAHNKHSSDLGFANLGIAEGVVALQKRPKIKLKQMTWNYLLLL